MNYNRSTIYLEKREKKIIQSAKDSLCNNAKNVNHLDILPFLNVSILRDDINRVGRYAKI